MEAPANMQSWPPKALKQRFKGEEDQNSWLRRAGV